MTHVHDWLWVEEAVDAMREWLSECTWADIDTDDVADLTASEVVSGVRRHYEGGVQAFLRDAWMLT